MGNQGCEPTLRLPLPLPDEKKPFGTEAGGRDGGMKTQQGRLLLIALCAQLCQLFVTPSIVAHQAPLSMEYSRQAYRSGLQFPAPGDLPGPGIEPGSPVSPALQADSLPAEPLGKPLSTGFSRQEYWSGWPRPPPGDLPDPGIEPASLMSLMSQLVYWVPTPVSGMVLGTLYVLIFHCELVTQILVPRSLHELQEG